MKRLVTWSVLVAAMTASGCEEQSREMVIPPPPLPRYLSRDITPAPTEASGAGDRAATAEAAAPTAADDQPQRNPEAIAQEVRALEPALRRLQQRRDSSQSSGEPLGADEAPPIRQGDPPVPVSVAVPMEADQPVRRSDDGAMNPAGRVSLTAIEAAGDADAVPLPQDGSATATPGEARPEDAAPPTGEATLENLTKHYEALAAASPADVEAARTLRFLYFLSGQDEKSLEAIPALPVEDQNLWRGLMWAMISARDRMPGMSRAAQAAEVLDALGDVRTILQRQAPLELGEVRFCRVIDDFGNYTPLAMNRFRPGEQALLYTELRHFTSEKGADGLWRVRLNLMLALETPEGKAVWQESIPNIEDTCRRPRQDFFLTTRIPLPGDLKPGSYVLKVTFEDASALKQAGARLELEITGPAGGR